MRVIYCIAAIVCVLFFVIAVDRSSTLLNLKGEAIQLGYARYNPYTGVWEWKTNRVQIITDTNQFHGSWMTRSPIGRMVTMLSMDCVF